MRHIVIGMGEVGKSVFEVLKSCKEYKVGWHDLDACNVPFEERAHAMHVCIPHSKTFESIVRSYIAVYHPSLVIVHSSVPIGTCDANQWVHSPIRGVHPNIAQGIRTFVKYFGGLRSEEAAEIFSVMDIKTVSVRHARDCEAAKLWDTTQYGMMIVLNKIVYDWCAANKVNPEFVYKEFNRSYNEGYRELGRPEVVRPYLKNMPGPIGGHCVMQNLPLLGENQITDMINLFNSQIELTISGEVQ